MGEAAREAAQPRAASFSPAPGEQRQHDDGDDEQDEDEPQVADPEAAVVVAAVLDVVLQEVAADDVVPVRAGVAGVELSPVPRLWRDQHEDPEEQRDAQAEQPLAEIRARAALAQREVGGGAGQQEEQGHVPHGDEAEHVAHRHRERVRLHVPGVVGVEDAQRVEGEEQQHGQHTQPVDVVQSGAGCVESLHVCSSCSGRSPVAVRCRRLILDYVCDSIVPPRTRAHIDPGKHSGGAFRRILRLRPRAETVRLRAE